jgi:subtilisin family serine protease
VDSVRHHRGSGSTDESRAIALWSTLLISGLLIPSGACAQSAGTRDRAVAQHIAREGHADVIVVLREGKTITESGPDAARAKSLLRLRQDAVLDALPSGSFQLRHRYARLNGFAGRVNTAGYDWLLGDPRIEAVYLNRKVHATLAEGRGLSRVDPVQRAGIDGTGVTVAIVDTGIDYANVNLGGCFGAGCKVVAGFDFVNNDENPIDDHRHGTAVAGIVAAEAAHRDPSRRVLGMAPGAKLVALKVLDQAGTGTISALENALDWILEYNEDPGVPPDEKLQIVVLSLGDCERHDDPHALPCSGTLTADAIEALVRNRVNVFVAAGNSGFDDGVEFPACVPGAIAVGAVYDADVGGASFLDCEGSALCADPATAAGRIACYSNLSDLVSVMAPANDTRTTSIGFGGIVTGFGGTSAAAPYAAGAAALLLHAVPGLTPAEMELRLRQNVRLTASDPARSSLTFPVIDGVLQLPSDGDADGRSLGEQYCAAGEQVGCDSGSRRPRE